MKKLFVSVPMKGRTDEEIRANVTKMKTIAEAYEGEALELIDSYITDNPPIDNRQAIWYLAKALEKLSEADLFVSIDGYWNWNGCAIEVETARRYGIKSYFIPTSIIIEEKCIVENCTVN